MEREQSFTATNGRPYRSRRQFSKPIHAGKKGNKDDTVTFLVDKGADVNIKDEHDVSE